MTEKDFRYIQEYTVMFFKTSAIVLLIIAGINYAYILKFITLINPPKIHFVAPAEASIPRSAVIHHTASPDVSAQTIDSWHKERGWDGIGYHYVIRADGSIESGRAIEKQGAHAKGRNHMTGIVLTGYDKFSEAQISSLKNLIKRLNITHIEPHHRDCPGHGIALDKIAASTGATFTDWEAVRYVSR